MPIPIGGATKQSRIAATHFPALFGFSTGEAALFWAALAPERFGGGVVCCG